MQRFRGDLAGAEGVVSVSKKLIVGAVLLAAVVGTGVAYSAASPSVKLAKQDRLWGGGYVAPGTCSTNVPDFCPPAPRHFAFDAHAEGDGSGAVGNSSFNNQTSRTVTCLRVDGDTATVGGVVVEGTLGNPGDYYLQHFVDRGTSSPASQRDLASGHYTGPPSADWPEGFPYVCPPADETTSVPPVYLEMAGGDITVQDAPTD
jgi:hypothetical protein